jgi:O-antigen biosynthesis protein
MDLSFSPPSALELNRISFEKISRALSMIKQSDYAAWIQSCGDLKSARRDQLTQRCSTIKRRPVVSLIWVHERETIEDFVLTLQSLSRQIYSNFELIVVIDALQKSASNEKINEIIANRISVRLLSRDTNAGSSEAQNAALAEAAGEFVGFIGSGDLLAPEALAEIVLKLVRFPKCVVVFTDEDWIDASGERLMPRFKSNWDWDAHLAFDLLGQLCIMRRELILNVGSLRPEYDPAAHFDLHCRLAEFARPTQILHIPRVLYHRRLYRWGQVSRDDGCDRYGAAARRAVLDHVRRTDQLSEVDVQPAPLRPYLNRIIRPLPDPPPLVSVLVPTRDRADLLRTCVRGVLASTDYPSIELVILDNESAELETNVLFDELRCDTRVSIIHCPGPFNYSQMNNRGVAAAKGEIIVLLNNDIEVCQASWLREMVSHAIRPEVGCVGAKLLYADRRVQHGGVVLSPDGMCTHVGRLAGLRDAGDYAQLAVTKNYLAVTGACIVMRKKVFEEVGGFDAQNLKVAYNDIDLCLRLTDFGYLVVWTPFAQLLHLESASRGRNTTSENQAVGMFERDTVYTRWYDLFHSDPYHNPNLLITWDGMRLCSPRPETLRPNERIQNGCSVVGVANEQTLR